MRIFLLLLAALSLTQHPAAFAQKTNKKTSPAHAYSNQRETLILPRKGNGSTTIEISNDGIYVDGEKVASREDLTNQQLTKKIIIGNGQSDGSGFRHYGMQRSSGRAVLGVSADPKYEGSGAYLKTVAEESAADEAGLREGDVITRIDSNYIASADDLVQTVRSYSPGDKVTIQYKRDEREREVKATLKNAGDTPFPQMFQYGFPRGFGDSYQMPPLPHNGFERPEADEPKPRLGLMVEEMDNEGVRVMSVREDTPADKAGFRKDDVIISVDGDAVRSVEDLQRHVEGLKAGSRMTIGLMRDGDRMTMNVTIPKPRNIRDL